MTIRHEKSNGMLVTTLEGEVDVEQLERVLESTVRAAALDGYHLLIDLRATKAGEDLSYPDVYKVVKKMAEYPEVKNYCVALLDRYRDSFEKAQFFEVVASESGCKVRSFIDEKEAEKWLDRHDSPC